MKFHISRTSDDCRITENPPTKVLACVRVDGSWYCAINTLEDLINLSDVEGEIIIDTSYARVKYLEIYDAYRE